MSDPLSAHHLSARGRRGVLAACVAALVAIFAARACYEYPAATARLPRLAPGHFVDPRYWGASFQLVGEVRSARRLPQGIVLLDVFDAERDMRIDVSSFPSLGTLRDQPERGDMVRVTGSLGMYRGRPQLKPLSAAHVQVLRGR